MTPSELEQLTPQTWWRLADEQGRAWQLLRSDAGWLVLESPPLLLQPSDPELQHALSLGWLQPFQSPSRLLLREGGLRLQASWPTDALPDLNVLWPVLMADLQRAHELLQAMTHEEPVQELVGERPAATPAQQALMQQLMDSLESDAELGPLCELDEDSAELLLEPDQEAADWLFLMRPAPQAGGVHVALPQALLPEDPAARHAALQDLLAGNCALQLGPLLQQVVDPGGQQAWLLAAFEPDQSDLATLRQLLGHMLATDEELTGHRDSDASSVNGQDPHEWLRMQMHGLRA